MTNAPDHHVTPDLPPAVEVPDLPGAGAPSGNRRSPDDADTRRPPKDRPAPPTTADPSDEPS
jgi:hypothetical protein